MNPFSHVVASLYAAWRLANLDRAAVAGFDLSVQGYWRSFLAALIGLPLFLLLSFFERHMTEALAVTADTGVSLGFEGYYLNVTVIYVLTWPLFAAGLIFVAKWLKVERAYVPVVVAFNWSRVMAMAIRLPVAALAASRVLSANFTLVALVLTFVLVLYYQWFVLKAALERGVGGAQGNAAALILLMDIALAFLLSNAVSFVLGEPIQLQ